MNIINNCEYAEESKKNAIVKKLKPDIREADLPPISPEKENFLNLIATLIVNLTLRDAEDYGASTLTGIPKDQIHK